MPFLAGFPTLTFALMVDVNKPATLADDRRDHSLTGFSLRDLVGQIVEIFTKVGNGTFFAEISHWIPWWG
jgi:hypothetical protein